MKEDRFYLSHILNSIERILEYTSDGEDVFLRDTKTQDAVIRNLEIIGEAVKALSQSLIDQHDDIPWKQISGMRDILIHHYFGVKLETVWEVVDKHLSPLKDKVVQLLSDDTDSMENEKCKD